MPASATKPPERSPKPQVFAVANAASADTLRETAQLMRINPHDYLPYDQIPVFAAWLDRLAAEHERGMSR